MSGIYLKEKQSEHTVLCEISHPTEKYQSWVGLRAVYEKKEKGEVELRKITKHGQGQNRVSCIISLLHTAEIVPKLNMQIGWNSAWVRLLGILMAVPQAVKLLLAVMCCLLLSGPQRNALYNGKVHISLGIEELKL